jgi:predicted nucleic acid-binding protein
LNVFVDTSAFLAVLDRNDRNHESAKGYWIHMLEFDHHPVCHNYILVETSAVALRRLGLEAARVFQRAVVPALRPIWVTREVHEAAVAAHILTRRRSLSLVDCVSFELMRRTGLTTAFAFDRHFSEFGYTVVPSER